ncbi:MAG: hypothetical protein ABI871_02420 [Chthoniobacterales bacterium]
MRRRLPGPGTPLDQKQSELAQRERQLRDEMLKLEQMIAEAPRVAEETTRRQREELLRRANDGGSRLDVSMALQDKRYYDSGSATRPRRRSLRKERREGRLLFLLMVIALFLVVLWLANHLHF